MLAWELFVGALLAIVGPHDISTQSPGWVFDGGAYAGAAHVWRGGKRLEGVVLPATCRSNGAAYHRFEPPKTPDWRVDVEHVAECDHVVLAFLVATNQAGKKRYFGFQRLSRGTATLVPFDTHIADDERVGVVFGANGSGIGCGGDTVILRVTVRP